MLQLLHQRGCEQNVRYTRAAYLYTCIEIMRLTSLTSLLSSLTSLRSDVQLPTGSRLITVILMFVAVIALTTSVVGKSRSERLTKYTKFSIFGLTRSSHGMLFECITLNCFTES